MPQVVNEIKLTNLFSSLRLNIDLHRLVKNNVHILVKPLYNTKEKVGTDLDREGKGYGIWLRILTIIIPSILIDTFSYNQI
jgi:hypothetical protein